MEARIRLVGKRAQRRAGAPLKATASVGFWSALAVTVFTLAFGVGAVVSGVLAPLPDWTGIRTFAAAFSSVQMLPIVMALLIIPFFLSLFAAIHAYAPPERAVWSLLGSAFAAVYSAVVAMNYFLQLVVLRPNILAGEIEGMAILAMTNPHSLFWALELGGYGFQSLATLAVAPIFSGGGLESWIRRLFVANGVLGIGLTALFLLLDEPLIVLAGLGIWALLFPAAMALTAVHFRRQAV